MSRGVLVAQVVYLVVLTAALGLALLGGSRTADAALVLCLAVALLGATGAAWSQVRSGVRPAWRGLVSRPASVAGYLGTVVTVTALVLLAVRAGVR